MTNEDFVRRIAVLYNQAMSLQNDEDYEINRPQAEKLIKVLTFFAEESKRQDGKLEPVCLSPREMHGGVTATFLVFDIYNEKIQRFCDAMKGCSAIGIDSTDEGVCISCTIPDVFVPIDRTKN